MFKRMIFLWIKWSINSFSFHSLVPFSIWKKKNIFSSMIAKFDHFRHIKHSSSQSFSPKKKIRFGAKSVTGGVCPHLMNLPTNWRGHFVANCLDSCISSIKSEAKIWIWICPQFWILQSFLIFPMEKTQWARPYNMLDQLEPHLKHSGWAHASQTGGCGFESERVLHFLLLILSTFSYFYSTEECP